MIKVEFKGLAELERNLQQLPSVVSSKWVNGALRSGTKLIRDKAILYTPERTAALRDTIRIGRGKKISDDNRRDYFVISGNRKKSIFYAPT
jgi:hypothetical protein